MQIVCRYDGSLELGYPKPQTPKGPTPCVKARMLQSCQAPVFVGSSDLWGFSKVGGTLLGVPKMRITKYWGLFWGPPISGNYHL